MAARLGPAAATRHPADASTLVFSHSPSVPLALAPHPCSKSPRLVNTNPLPVTHQFFGTMSSKSYEPRIKGMPRVYSIDYLRGLMAASVMIYHFLSWSIGVPESDTLIGRLGVYAVSTFYIISGISLYLVYKNNNWNIREVGAFTTKRYFRIAPAFWLAMLLMIIFHTTRGGEFIPDWARYASNLSLTFGFYAPRDYIPGGGWSIGNEMVFYALFPIIMIAAKKPRHFLIVTLISGLAYLYFAFYAMSSEKTLAEQWDTYIHPMNQVFLFSIGIAIGWIRDRWGAVPKNISYLTFISSGLLLTFYPASGNQANIVTEYNRLLFTIFCSGLCFSALNIPMKKKGLISRSLKFFGDISYSLYLLHSVVAMYTLHLVLPRLGAFSPSEKATILFSIALPISIALSYLIYRFIEKPAIYLGKNLSINVLSYRQAERDPARDRA